MSEHQQIDLSALEPRDWGAITARTMDRVDAVLASRLAAADDPFTLIASWRRSVLAAAAVILAVVIPAEIALEIRERRAEAVHRLATLSVESVQRHEPLSGSEILRTIAAGSAQ